jgi:hypothetical protein
MKNKYFALLFLIFIGTTISCDDELEKLNPNGVTTDTYYSNADELERAVNSAYAVTQSVTLVAREWFFLHDLRSDEMVPGGGQLEAPRKQLLIGAHDPSNYVTGQVFAGLYALIHRANIVISAEIAGTDEAKVKRIVGEAKFLRAWAYFDLVTNWGGVPLYDKPVKSVQDFKGRATVDEVYASIISNLTDAIAILPDKYEGSDLGRATKGAARMLLARVYMQRANFTDAQAQLLEITGPTPVALPSPKGYDLVANYNDNFLEETEYNRESVFEIGFIDNSPNFGWGEWNVDPGLGNETSIHNQEICPTSWGNLIPSPSLLKEFETTNNGFSKTDPRFGFSFYKTGDAIVTGPLTDAKLNIEPSVYEGQTIKIGWRKHTILYKNAADYYPSGINDRIMRYAEVLLMLAECLNENGNQTEAINTLNLIRKRTSVNMPLYGSTEMNAQFPVTSKEEVFKAIVHEKRVELAGEEIRNRDILRWRANGKIPSVIPEPINYFAEKYKLIPIPQYEVDNNPNIGLENQNPGY